MTVWDYFHNAVISSAAPVVLEIGVGRGEDTVKMAEHLLQHGKPYRLIGFECEDKNFPFITERNIPGFQLRPVAISDRDGTLEFVGSGDWPYSGSLKQPRNHRNSYPWIKWDEPRFVECAKLDTVFNEEHLTHVDFIWQDVQGSEDLVLAGGQEALKQTRWLYTEYYNSPEYEGQIPRDTIHERLPGKWEMVHDFGDNVLFRNTAL